MTVNLESLTLPELATLAKRYFFIGCFFLPIFWAVNLLWYAIPFHLDSFTPLFLSLGLVRLPEHKVKVSTINQVPTQ